MNEATMIFEIKHRFSGAVLFKLETASLKLCVQAAVKEKASLSEAYLSGAIFDIPPASDEQAVKNLDQVRGLILEDKKLLNMSHWHDDDSEWEKHTCAEEAVCGTTHCLAGWLQVCSTDEKIRKLDPALAGTLLAPVAAKMFYANDAGVIGWLQTREYAKEEDARSRGEG